MTFEKIDNDRKKLRCHDKFFIKMSSFDFSKTRRRAERKIDRVSSIHNGGNLGQKTTHDLRCSLDTRFDGLLLFYYNLFSFVVY